MNCPGILSQLQAEFQLNKLLSSLTAGLVLGVIGVLTYITPMAALIFSQDLSPFLSIGISITLFSSAVVGIVVALQSSFVGTIALPVPEEMTILAAIAATIAAQMANNTPEEVLLTIVAAFTLTSLLTGLFLFALGRLQLGELIRFLPYPVIGGFLAGLGCLLSQGALQVMTDLPLTLANLSAFFQPELLLRWLPGLVFAIVLLIISRRYTHFLIMPVSFLAATALFYLVWVLAGHSLADASSQGWLLGPFPEGQPWRPLSFAALRQANWSIVFGQLSSMVTVMLITALSLLMVSSGIELTTQRDLNLNQELRATGIGCFLSGLFGGVVGSHGVTTVLVGKMGVRSRLVGVFAGIVYLLVLFLGISLISFFPKPVLGGLLLFLGFDLLVKWVYDSWFQLPKADYVIVLLIMVTIATVGLVEGVTLGFIAATILFVINYSRIDVAKYTLSGTNFSSHVKRSPNQTRLLRQKGDQIYVLQLQGLIFFGTANRLLNQIRRRFAAPSSPTLKFILLDFRRVNGLDSSAVLSFVKLKQLVQKEQVSLLFTGLSPEIAHQLQLGGAFVQDESSVCKVFPDLDAGMEWCEELILDESQFRRRRNVPMALQLGLLLSGFVESDHITILMNYLQMTKRSPGDVLFQTGHEPTEVYFVESGQISTWTETDGVRSHRVQTLGAGTICGEVEFFSREPYRMTAMIEQDSTLYQLSLDSLHQMQQEHPDLAIALREFINKLLAERLLQAYEENELLLR